MGLWHAFYDPVTPRGFHGEAPYRVRRRAAVSP